MPIKLENYKERLIDKTIELYLKTFKANCWSKMVRQNMD